MRTQSVIARIATIVVGVLVLVGVATAPAVARPSAPPAHGKPVAGGPQRGLPPNSHPVSPPIAPRPTGRPARPGGTRPAPVTSQSAAAQAKATGKPVAVTEDTTDTSDTVANPDGTFTMRSTVLPVRTRRDGRWVPLDPTLHANPDGSFSPAASADGVTFTGGGTGPMVTLTRGTGTLSLTWPGALPAPTVHGDTATYASVLPGVDLELTATASDYREVLVVHDEDAAANPALAAIHLAVTVHGLTLHADATGQLTATDPHGTAVFRDATPIMWDSTADSKGGPAPSAAGPGTGHVTALGVRTASVRAGSAQLTVVPDPAALTGAHNVFPLYIDPELGPAESNWAEITANGWHYYDAAQLAQVGDCTGWSYCEGLTVARSYFEFPTPALDNAAVTAQVYSATLTITEEWNADGCATSQPVEIDQTGAVGSGTRWPGPANPIPLTTVGSAGSENCAASVLGHVESAAQAAATAKWTTLTLGLRAPNEGTKDQWKQFDAASAVLSVTYKYPPNSATGLTVANGVTCDGNTYVPDGPITLLASGSDNNNPPLDPGLWFDVSNDGYTTETSSGPIRIASGTTGSWTVPGTLAPGGYQWRVSVDNDPNQADDQWGGTVATSSAFTQLSAPTQAPTVSTGQYPAGYWGEPADNPGGIGFFGNGAQHLAGFTWTLDGAGTESVPDTSQCDYDQTFADGNGNIVGGYVPADGNGNASVNLPAGLSVGYHTVYARGFDFAHNLTPESVKYEFYVSAPIGTAAGHWQEAETTAYTQPTGQNDTLAQQANCCGIAWSGNAQLLWGGTAAGQSFTMPFSVSTSQNYQIQPVLTEAADYGILSFQIDGTPVTVDGKASFDSYSGPIAKTYVDLGTAYLDAGKPHTLTVTAVGTNPASVGNRYQAGIDGWFLTVTNQLDAESAAAVRAVDQSGQGITPAVEPDDGTTNWPGGAQLVYPATAPGQAVQLAFQVPMEADYALGLAITQSPDAGQLEFTVDGKTVLANTDTNPFDAYFATERNYYLPLGGVHLLPGSHAITVTVRGRNSASSGFKVGIGQVTAAAVANATATSFTAAMNNHGIAADGQSAGGGFDGGLTLSADALRSVGVVPGSTLATGGATFAIPPAADGNDNVVADGQTIPLPAGNDTAVGLLVASSCGWTPEVPAAINYTDSTFTNPLMPTVPDWIYGTGATVTVPYVDSNGAPLTNRAAHLYALFLPADPKRTVKSITLPYTGTGMESYGCNTTDNNAALHVFAIAPRPVDAAPAGGGTWLGAWSAPVDAAALPPGGALTGRTVRMVVHPTTTGATLRIRLSDVDAMGPVTVDAATVAAQAGTTGTGATALATPRAVTFGGSAGITVPAGGEIESDSVAFPSTTGGSGDLLVSLHIAAAPTQVPVHATMTNATYLAADDDTATTDGTPFGAAVPGDYMLTGVDVAAAATGGAGTIAVLGDQTSVAGAPGGECGGGTAYACTWVDDLAATGGAQVPGSLVDASRAGTPPQDEWRLDDGTGPTAADPVGGHPAVASGGVTWTTGPAGNADGSVTLDGTGSLATSGPVLDTTRSFTVSAWVRPSSLGNTWQTFVTQEADQVGGFALEYDPGSHDWAFTRAETDGPGPVVDRAESADPAQAQQWTQLTGTFDAGTGTLNLYVDGGYAGTSVDNARLPATGPLVIGHGFTGGAADNFVTGGIADVQVYQRALSTTDAHDLWEQQGPGQPAAGAGAPSGFNTAITDGTDTRILATSPVTELDQLLTGEPNLRTVILSLGANDVIDGASKDRIKQDLTALILKARAFGLTNRMRPDGNQIQVVLTTIPPLGLTDQREQVREQVNADIAANYTNYGADGYVDFDEAVTGPTEGQAAANLLTNGQPNARYYTDLAAAVLAALRFPPKITL